MKTQIILDGNMIAQYDFLLPLNEHDVVTYSGVQWYVEYKHLNITLNVIYIYLINQQP
jgi:hypothetical protein